MFIPMDLGAIKEQKPVPGGAKYDVVITSCESGKSKSGKPQLVCSLGIEGHEDAPNVRHYVSLPGDGDDASKVGFKLLFLKRFLSAFGVTTGKDGFDTDELASELTGARANVELGLSEPDDNGNVYNNLILPKLKDEGGSVGKGAPKPPKR